MSNKSIFINRELSWLSFNERVLMEAADKTNPLLERLRFVAIYSSNLDEFFMIRVAGIKEQINAGYTQLDFAGLAPTELLQEIKNRTNRLSGLQQSIFLQIKEELCPEGILFPSPNDPDFATILEAIFVDEIMPTISPVTIDPSHPFPFVYSRRMCILVDSERNGKEHKTLIMLPENLRRAYRVKKGKNICVFMAEDIIRMHLELLLKGYKIKSAGVFRVTRDADLAVDSDESGDLLDTIEHLVSKRKTGDVCRVEASGIDAQSMKYLQRMIGFTDEDVEDMTGTIDLTFLFGLTEMKSTLTFPPFQPRPVRLPVGDDIFEQIKERPIYLFRPYNSFGFVTDLIAHAAADDDVLAIKLTLYRAGKNSKIISSLLRAAKSGKQVSVVVELKARFDEERNISWARHLEEAGCLVTYGIVGLKIHAKCMLIVRREKDRIVRYTHVATGNYNEVTAGIYTDVDMITADDALGRDATQLFNYLMGFTEEEHWEVMKVAPFALRPTVLANIHRETELAKNGKFAKITMKLNSLIDEEIMLGLYEASLAGVKVDLIVRGICGLRAGVNKLSENIRVISIVGRFLEHPRVLYFHADGEEKYYITSADMMPRNLNGRVELMVEITDQSFKESLAHFLRICLKDNTKAWELHDDIYQKLAPTEGEEALSSQKYFLENEI